MTTRLQIAEATPALILGHDGVAAAHLTALEEAVPGLSLGLGYEDALIALAQGWSTLSDFGPLKGHRQKGAALSPDAPWYGAERTDPDLFLRRMGPAILPGIVPVPEGAQSVGIVSRRLFWTWEEVQNLCTFFLAALPRGVIALPVGPAGPLVEEFRRQTGWREEAAQKAVTAMDGYARQAAETHPGRAILWPLDEPGKLPDPLRVALSGKGGGAG